jgi:hypothetical protein
MDTRKTYKVTVTINVPIYGDGPSPEDYLKGVMAQAVAEEIGMYGEDDFDMLCGHIASGNIKVSYKDVTP